jgi:hypothetical protein
MVSAILYIFEPPPPHGGLTLQWIHFGGKVAVGGRVDVAEKYMEPTIITGGDWTDSTMQVFVALRLRGVTFPP